METRAINESPGEERKVADEMKPGRWSRPGDPAWPSNDAWEALSAQVGGRLIELMARRPAV